jgi:hypothetical protein
MPSEGILAIEGIIEYHDALGKVRLALKMGKEKCECESRAVSCRKRVFETWSVSRRPRVAQVYRYVGDYELVR